MHSCLLLVAVLQGLVSEHFADIEADAGTTAPSIHWKYNEEKDTLEEDDDWNDETQLETFIELDRKVADILDMDRALTGESYNEEMNILLKYVIAYKRARMAQEELLEQLKKTRK